MQQNSTARFLTRQAIIAALYVVLTNTLPAFAYGPIQFRYSEIMTWLAFYDRKNIWGLTIGCFVSNIWSPYGIWDMIFGTLGTFLAVWCMSRVKNKTLASLFPAAFSFIYGLEAVILSDTPLNFFLITGQIMLSELIIVAIVGRIVIEIMEKNPTFIKAISDEYRPIPNRADV